ncbi:GNAT family acetyltransferase [Natrialba magadii ATCC 43099]|uniref:GNAT family acetyltransferase n=1 Tax=Natrialba magadii (strain ATCC 43099 / DSM 3394 / CCM 3739 / CIP 104546 / IAM 13178 / JCM 8861 / NBRC 102185 / NCIMB 2190 / MS3) TaxID=547559 RepID=D3SSY3_NATMM|nr:GNAT family N-acetyltransferase [Natrialba magadii]ADD04929.1 GNAT family acetyltransferase [Natrialba magadii ATCC 43099]ELY23978.1 hypothetical protein C500_19270 [Natrialba magadii ATCC 43099]
MTQFRSTRPRPQASYTVRPFRPSDRSAFLSLYDEVFDRKRGTGWFRWKFERNPFVDHVPIIVAERGGELVGARSFFAQPVRNGETVFPAFQPCDTMVHSDHRRQGLFGRMNELALERYAGQAQDPAFCFNFPNEHSKQGNINHGWRDVGSVPMYYRPQDPSTVLRAVTGETAQTEPTDSAASIATAGSTESNVAGSSTRLSSPHPAKSSESPLTVGPSSSTATTANATEADSVADDRGVRAADRVAQSVTAAVPTVHRAGDRLLATTDTDLTIEQHDRPPAAVLAATYQRSIPDGFHTNRSETFYRWRFDRPTQTYPTYVATRDDEPVAALVTAPNSTAAGESIEIIETLPRDLEAEADALESLLVRALADARERAFVTAFGETLPKPLRYRFYPDTRFPLSTILQPACRTLLVRDLVGEESRSDANTAGGFETCSAADWCLSRLDLDTT